VIWYNSISRNVIFSVLLNGVPVNSSCAKEPCAKGTLLPFFVLAAVFLQVVNKAYHDDLLQEPLPKAEMNFPMVQYVDDTMSRSWKPANLSCNIEEILHVFSESTGLKINISKSLIIPINVPDAKLPRLATEKRKEKKRKEKKRKNKKEKKRKERRKGKEGAAFGGHISSECAT
jgi:hypothetical protein